MRVEDRRLLMDMAKRRAKSGSGSALRILNEARERYSMAGLVPDMGTVRYVIVGGLATARYMPERMTLDTDILIAAEDLEAAESRLRTAGCALLGPLSISGSTWRMPNGRPLDLIALAAPWVREAIAGGVRDAEGYHCIDLPYLVLMKLEAGRLQDLADVSRMLGFAAAAHLEATRRTVLRFRPQDAEDLESLIRFGKLEHE